MSISLDINEVAAVLNGNEYSREGSPELFKTMKAAGLVAVFGASDDLMEFRGAIYDELGAYDRTTAYLTQDGLLKNECDNDECPHFKRLKTKVATIDAVWGKGDWSWSYETAIPHVTFDIMEDGEPYCKGIVFALKDALHRAEPRSHEVRT